MDIDVFVAAHTAMWKRLEFLVARASRPRRLTGAELDELVDLYQRTATHLSVVRTSSPDPALVDRLSSLVARARSAVSGSRNPSWRELARFVTVTFPAAVYRARWWVAGAAAGSLLLALALGVWIVRNPGVQHQIAAPAEVRQLVNRDFAEYYRSAPASSFAAKVWTNNVWVSAQALAAGVLLGLPTLYALFTNAANLGVVGALMVGNGRGALFFGLILPHGLLELTAVFIAGGVGLRTGWAVVDPGERSRPDALAREGRAAATVALGLVGVLAVAGTLEAFITPSGLPTWARVGVGVTVEAAFLAGLGILGRRAVAAGETGDLGVGLGADEAPVA